MDVISIRGIRVQGRHGAEPGERDREQPFELDVEAHADLSRASQTDDLADTVNYAELHERIVRIVREHSYVLLERLAAVILDAMFENERIVAAQVRIGKPGLLAGATPSITLWRARP